MKNGYLSLAALAALFSGCFGSSGDFGLDDDDSAVDEATDATEPCEGRGGIWFTRTYWEDTVPRDGCLSEDEMEPESDLWTRRHFCADGSWNEPALPAEFYMLPETATCEVDDDGDDDDATPNEGEASCADGEDNDGDGYEDCADQDCFGSPACEDNDVEDCADGEDNDGDGYEDCADQDCWSSQDCEDVGDDDDDDIPDPSGFIFAATWSPGVTNAYGIVWQYRVDGGPWTTISSPSGFVTSVSGSVTVPSGIHTLEFQSPIQGTGVAPGTGWECYNNGGDKFAVRGSNSIGGTSVTLMPVWNGVGTAPIDGNADGDYNDGGDTVYPNSGCNAARLVSVTSSGGISFP